MKKLQEMNIQPFCYRGLLFIKCVEDFEIVFNMYIDRMSNLSEGGVEEYGLTLSKFKI